MRQVTQQAQFAAGGLTLVQVGRHALQAVRVTDPDAIAYCGRHARAPGVAHVVGGAGLGSQRSWSARSGAARSWGAGTPRGRRSRSPRPSAGRRFRKPPPHSTVDAQAARGSGSGFPLRPYTSASRCGVQSCPPLAKLRVRRRPPSAARPGTCPGRGWSGWRCPRV